MVRGGDGFVDGADSNTQMDTNSVAQWVTEKTYRHGFRGMVGRLFAAALTVGLFWGDVPHSLLLAWVAAMAVVSAGASLLFLLWRRSPSPKHARWMLCFDIQVFFTSVVWGAAGYWFYDVPTPLHQSALVMVMVGVAVSPIISYGGAVRASVLAAVCTLLPLSVAILKTGSQDAIWVALLPLAFIAVLVSGSRELSKSVRETVATKLMSEANAAALVESERRYRNLFALSPDPMWLIVDGEFVMANRAAAECLGFEGELELVATHPSEVSPPMQPDGQTSFDKANQMMETAMRLGTHRFEWVHTRRSGETFPVEVTLVRMPHSGRDALFCIWRDITDRQASEAELRMTREAAVAATREKSDFLATMSHEIRTPLNAVIGLSELLANLTLSDEANRYTKNIHDAGRSLLTLINDILDFSKIEAGELSLHVEPFSLAGTVASVRAMFEMAVKTRNVALVCDIDPGVPQTVLGDEARIRQILVNLVGNAVKFTMQGTVRVHVFMGADGLVFLEVTDSGIGMDETTLSQIFSPFKQGDGSTTRRFGGTGLGLTIVRRLALIMRGDVSVSSELGRGSCFRVTLPLPEVRPMPAQPRRAPMAQVQGAIKVLVAEDAPTNQLVIGSMLRRLGVTWECVENGELALARCKEVGFDIVLMDCQMPVMDGLESCRRIRTEVENGVNIPIIALTANATADDRAACLRAGMSDFVAKPFSMVQIAETLSKWVTRPDG